MNPLIQKLETVAQLSHKDRLDLHDLCARVRTYEARAHVIRQGDRPESVHVVLEGWAARYQILANGSRQITGLAIPGDFCDIHVNLLARMDHSILALTPCRIAHIPGDRLSRLAAESPRISWALWWTSLLDEATLRQWIINCGRRDAYAAVAHLLCEMHFRMQMVGLVGQDDSFRLPLTQEDIGDATAMSSVHVNRTLKRLREDGLIELSHHELAIRDVTALRQAAGFRTEYFHLEAKMRGSWGVGPRATI